MRSIAYAAIAAAAFGCASATVDPAADAPVAPVSSVIRAATAEELELRERLRVTEFYQRREERTLVVARDPRSGLALWRTFARRVADPRAAFLHSEGGSPATAAVVATPERLVRFYVTAPPLRIVVHESTQSFPTAEEAERAIVAAIDSGTTATLHTRIATAAVPELYQYLIPPDAPLPHSPSLTEAHFENGSWLITLSGPSGNTAVVTLDSDYHLLDVKKDQ
jgi:hypothetical protein